MRESPVRNGALVLTCVGILPALFLAWNGFAQSSARLVLASGVLLSLLAGSGAAGGWVYDRTASLRASGAAGATASWVVVAATAIGLLALGIVLIAPTMQFTGSAAY